MKMTGSQSCAKFSTCHQGMFRIASVVKCTPGLEPAHPSSQNIGAFSPVLKPLRGRALGPQDLPQGRRAHLELLRAGFSGREEALDRVAHGVDRAPDRRVWMPLGVGEQLD